MNSINNGFFIFTVSVLVGNPPWTLKRLALNFRILYFVPLLLAIARANLHHMGFIVLQELSKLGVYFTNYSHCCKAQNTRF